VTVAIHGDVSLSVLVRPSYSTDWLEHLKRLAPMFNEVVVTCIDLYSLSCLEDLEARWREMGLQSQVIDLTPEKRPDLYFRDSAVEYLLGSPLVDEHIDSYYTSENLFPKDWSAIRNVGWRRCCLGWRLSLSSGEFVEGIDSVADVVAVLEAGGRDVAYARASNCDGRTEWRALLARNVPHIMWEGAAAERLDVGASLVAVAPNLEVVDSSALSGLHKDFRILYRWCRQLRWDVPPSALLRLARLCPHAGMSHLVPDLVRAHLDTSLDVEERAHACVLHGEYCEELGDFSSAREWYERSVQEDPGSKAYLRLSRTAFKLGDSAGCLDAYRNAIKYQSKIAWRDDGREDILSSLLLTNVSIADLGYVAEAKANNKTLHNAFDRVPEVDELCRKVAT
jgi:hypothetical protein